MRSVPGKQEEARLNEAQQTMLNANSTQKQQVVELNYTDSRTDININVELLNLN